MSEFPPMTGSDRKPQGTPIPAANPPSSKRCVLVWDGTEWYKGWYLEFNGKWFASPYPVPHPVYKKFENLPTAAVCWMELPLAPR